MQRKQVTYDDSTIDMTDLNSLAGRINEIKDSVTYKQLYSYLGNKYKNLYPGKHEDLKPETSEYLRQFKDEELSLVLKDWGKDVVEEKLTPFNLINMLVKRGYTMDLDAMHEGWSHGSLKLESGKALLATKGNEVITAPFVEEWPLLQKVEIPNTEVLSYPSNVYNAVSIISQFNEVVMGKINCIATLDGFNKSVGLNQYMNIDDFVIGSKRFITICLCANYEVEVVPAYVLRALELSHVLLKGMDKIARNNNRVRYRDGDKLIEEKYDPMNELLRLLNRCIRGPPIVVKSAQPIKMKSKIGNFTLSGQTTTAYKKFFKLDEGKLRVQYPLFKLPNRVNDQAFSRHKGATIDQACCMLESCRTARQENQVEISSAARAFYFGLMVPSSIADLCYMVTDLAHFILPDIVVLVTNKDASNLVTNFVRALAILEFKGTFIVTNDGVLETVCGKPQNGVYRFMDYEMKIQYMRMSVLTNTGLWNTYKLTGSGIIFDLSSYKYTWVAKTSADYHSAHAQKLKSNIEDWSTYPYPVVGRQSIFSGYTNMLKTNGMSAMLTCTPHNLVTYVVPGGVELDNTAFIVTAENLSNVCAASIMFNVARSLRHICGMDAEKLFNYTIIPVPDYIKQSIGNVVKQGLSYEEMDAYRAEITEDDEDVVDEGEVAEEEPEDDFTDATRKGNVD